MASAVKVKSRVHFSYFRLIPYVPDLSGVCGNWI